MTSLSAQHSPVTAEYRIPRDRMVERLRSQYGVRDERVLAVMRTVPRHAFVPEALRGRAYGDHALPIGANQTISQPYIVARMSELVEPDPDGRVLEIGAGSGYQTAILSLLFAQVYSIERIAELAREAQRQIRQLGIYNATVKCFDGTLGWSANAPYDAILVAAGGPEIPQPLVSQLKAGGRLVLPVGKSLESQSLVRVTRTRTGTRCEEFGPCVFVPLIGQYGWPSTGQV